MFEFSRRDYTFTRYENPGYSADDIWSDGTPTEIVVNGSLQPLNPRDIQKLPQGVQATGRYKFYTDADLNLTREINGVTTRADSLVVDGETYQVVSAGKYSQIFGHRRYILGIDQVKKGS